MNPWIVVLIVLSVLLAGWLIWDLLTAQEDPFEGGF
jgi:hypothetical protein